MKNLFNWILVGSSIAVIGFGVYFTYNSEIFYVLLLLFMAYIASLVFADFKMIR